MSSPPSRGGGRRVAARRTPPRATDERSADVVPSNDPRRAKLLEAARKRGYPRVAISACETALGGAMAWTVLCEFAEGRIVRAAAAALKPIPLLDPPADSPPEATP